MDFRKLHGENVTGELWLMRDTWEKLDRDHSHRIGLAKYPKKFNHIAIGNMMGEAWRVQGVRDLLDLAKKKKDMNSSLLIVLESILKLDAS